jgi:pimeloyl-ACP methyl ester carboxylesterase
MKPAVDALSRHVRVITFSLADEPSAGARFDETSGFSSYVEQVREALDAGGLDRAAICGVSFGGVIAAAFAARYPSRVSSLIMVSALRQRGDPTPACPATSDIPWLLAPGFCLGRCVSTPRSRPPTTLGGAESPQHAGPVSTFCATCFTPAEWPGVCIC